MTFKKAILVMAFLIPHRSPNFAANLFYDLSGNAELLVSKPPHVSAHWSLRLYKGFN